MKGAIPNLLQLLTATAGIISSTLTVPVRAAPNDPTPTPSACYSFLPTSTDASAYLSEQYSEYGGVPAEVTGAVATALATQLYSLERSWQTHPMASSVNAAIWSAAAEDPSGSAVVASISKSGYNYGQVTTNAWYLDHVPDDVKSDVAGYNSAWKSVFDRVVLETATSGNGAAAQAQCTGIAVAVVAGAVGVMAAM